MAKPAAIPPIDATPEELAKMLLQPPKAEKPKEPVGKPTGDPDTEFGLLRVASVSGTPHH